MKKATALLLSCIMVLEGCSSQRMEESLSSEKVMIQRTWEDTDNKESSEGLAEQENIASADKADLTDKVNNLDFHSLDDPDLLRYVEDTVYSQVVAYLDNDDYFVENVEAIYISKEYLDELAYNFQENIFFGYTLSQLEEQFQGERFVFALGDDGQTVVHKLAEYDDSFDQMIKNVAIGTGVILLCVTVSVVSGGAGASAVSMIFAASAKSATVMALSSGVLSGVSAGVVEGLQTKDFDKALKAAALSGSEGYKWGAFTGTIAGGAGEAIALKGATLKGLTMNQAAVIQKETKYPLDVIKEFRSMEQYEICKQAGLTTEMVSGKTALIRNIDLDYVDELRGLTNLERMQQGLAALDSGGVPYELHHIGQQADSTLAILTRAEHRLGENHKIWHIFGEATQVHGLGNDWANQKMEFWMELAELLTS